MYDPLAFEAKLTVAAPEAVLPKLAPTELFPWADHVPVAGLVPVNVALLPAQIIWSLPALGLGFTVTTTFAVSLQPAAFCATNTYVVVVVGFTDVGVVTAVPLAVPIVHTGLEYVA